MKLKVLNLYSWNLVNCISVAENIWIVEYFDRNLFDDDTLS